MFKRPFSFKGRIRRAEFGISVIIFYAGILLSLASTTLSPSLLKTFPNINESIIELFFSLLAIPCYWFYIAQAVKRSKDLGNSGWLIFIPFYNPFLLLFTAGQAYDNKYGKNPKEKNANPLQEDQIISTSGRSSNIDYKI